MAKIRFENSSSGSPPPPNGEEKRGAARHRVLRQGKILLEGQSIYCAVRDLSSDGAKLQVGDVELPEKFDLAIIGHPRRLRADVVWRSGEYAGVTFQPSLSSAEVEAVRPVPRITPRGR